MSDTLSLPDHSPAPIVDADWIIGAVSSVAEDVQRLRAVRDSSMPGNNFDAVLAEVMTKLHVLLAGSSMNSGVASSVSPGLRDLIAAVKGPEDNLPPSQKVNRRALLQASASPEVVAHSYALHDLMPGIEAISHDLGMHVREILGIVNNYKPYINVRGVLARKEAILEKYARGRESSRQERFVATVVQVFDTLTFQRQQEGALAPNPGAYERASKGLISFLQETSGADGFAAAEQMGFSFSPDIAQYHVPQGHIPLQRISPISSRDGEYTFIVIHQLFEAIFEDALRILREITPDSSESIQVSKFSDVSATFRLCRILYRVMSGLLSSEHFNAMRASLGIASGAQSEQYHQIERLIGMAHDQSFAHARGQAVRHIVGTKIADQLDRGVSGGDSLKERFRPSSQAIADGLRTLNIDLMALKVGHASMMLGYIPPHAIGTAGTQITRYFAGTIGPIFPVFTAQELTKMNEVAQAAIYSDPQNEGDHFASAKRFFKSLPRVVPPELLVPHGGIVVRAPSFDSLATTSAP